MNMHSVADKMVESPSHLYGKNKLFLNEYLGIFMHFESILFF